MKPLKLILASGSPRRKQLLTDAGFDFEVKTTDVDESFSEDTPVEQVAQLLAERKADAYNLQKDELVIAADTVVILDNQILNKPADREDAARMLRMLSGRTHTVVTGVCLKSTAQKTAFSDKAEVTFVMLTDEEIYRYIDNHKPYDKAGAYGAQDWIGLVGVERIEGNYFTVMGLPVWRVYSVLKDFNL